MREAVVYINPNQHTGHIKDAAHELTERWLKSEDVVGSILRQVGINYKPITTRLKLAERLDQVPQLLTYQDVRGYFGYTKRRLLYLADQETQRRLGAVKHTAYSLVESVILKRAVFEGVYLTQG